jgi:hypothetical protein
MENEQFCEMDGESCGPRSISWEGSDLISATGDGNISINYRFYPEQGVWYVSKRFKAGVAIREEVRKCFLEEYNAPL